MNQITTYAPLIGRILIGGFFLLSGLGKLGDVQGFAGYVQSGGLPGFLAWPTIIFEIGVGLAMVLGYQIRLAALAGAAFCVAAAVLYHANLADQIQSIMFFKNMAIAGGFLMFAAHGAGAVSLEGRRAAA